MFLFVKYKKIVKGIKIHRWYWYMLGWIFVLNNCHYLIVVETWDITFCLDDHTIILKFKNISGMLSSNFRMKDCKKQEKNQCVIQNSNIKIKKVKLWLTRLVNPCTSVNVVKGYFKRIIVLSLQFWSIVVDDLFVKLNKEILRDFRLH